MPTVQKELVLFCKSERPSFVEVTRGASAQQQLRSTVQDTLATSASVSLRPPSDNQNPVSHSKDSPWTIPFLR